MCRRDHESTRGVEGRAEHRVARFEPGYVPANRFDLAETQRWDEDHLAAFRRWHEAQPTTRERLQDVADGSPQIGDAARRAGRFLSLAGLVAVLLCAVAVAVSARSYVSRHLDSVALMKTLGATRAFVLAVSVTQLLCLSVAAGVPQFAAAVREQPSLITGLRAQKATAEFGE